MPPFRLALALLLFLGCGRCPGQGHPGPPPFPQKPPRVATWPRLLYAPQPPDAPPDGDTETPRAAEIRAALEARYGEPFLVPLVSGLTFSAPGWPGGVEGDFRAHPAAKPELLFGGSHHGELVDNYPCIRAVQPVLAWARGAARERAVVATHPCEGRGQAQGEVTLWVFDGSGLSVDERVAALQSSLSLVLDPLARAEPPLSSVRVIVSFHAPGSEPTLRQVITTSRRGEHARNRVRHREHAAVELRWRAGTWTRRDDRRPRATAVEDAVAAAVRPRRPPNASFEVLRHGPVDATVDQLASQPGARETVDVFVRITGDHDEQGLADWVTAAQHAVDPRLLLVWHFTLCDAGAGSPWAEPAQCQRGWDSLSLFSLDEPRRPPEFWPYPPAGSPPRGDEP